MPRPESHYFSPSAPSQQTERAIEATINGVTLPFVTSDGVFSKSALDEGSHLLLETALRHNSWPEKAKLADLGCGWGAISCFVAALVPQTLVFGCDINERAVALARQNAKLNKLENAFFWCGDGLEAARSDFFDVIFCNPPVRAGNETIARLFEGAQRCLKPEGELWVVLRTAQGAKSWQKRLRTQFGTCDTIEIKSGYRILKCKMQNRVPSGQRQKIFARFGAYLCILHFAFCILSGCHRTVAPPVKAAIAPPAVPQIWGGEKGQKPGQFNEPRALAVAHNGFVYAVDSSGYVQKWTDNGKFVKRWRVPSIDKGRPEGLAVTKSGNIAVCDTHYSKIRLYSPEGKLLRSFGTYGPQKGGFLLATGICVDEDGFLYIADYGGEYDRISKWTEQGKLIASWDGHGDGPRQFRRPCGLAISKEGDLLVADICNHRIQRLDRKTGAFKGQIGTPGREAGQLTYVYGVATDKDGFIYTAEYATNRVQKWTPDGQFISSWGSAGRAPGQLFNPWGLAIGPNSAIYIADTGNHRVQKIYLPQTAPAKG